MATVAVPVLKPLIYQGRSYVRGEIIDLEPVVAAAMARAGDVTLTKGAQIERKDLQVETPVRTRRSYRRKDLIADPAE